MTKGTTMSNTDVAPEAAPDTDQVEGWRDIAQRLSQRTTIAFTEDAAQRLSRRKHDPLPVRRWGPPRRPRVVADGLALDQWADRQWHSDQPD